MGQLICSRCLMGKISIRPFFSVSLCLIFLSISCSDGNKLIGTKWAHADRSGKVELKFMEDNTFTHGARGGVWKLLKDGRIQMTYKSFPSRTVFARRDGKKLTIIRKTSDLSGKNQVQRIEFTKIE